MVVISKRNLLWYEIVRRNLGINLQSFKLLKSSRAFVLMGHFWLNNKLQANGKCTLLLPAVRGGNFLLHSQFQIHIPVYSALDCWCLAMHFLKTRQTILKKSIEIMDWITGWVILPLESTLWSYSLRRLLEICVQQWNYAKPKNPGESFTNLYSQPLQEVIHFITNRHSFLFDKSKAMFKMLWNSRDQGRTETSCNSLSATAA